MSGDGIILLAGAVVLILIVVIVVGAWWVGRPERKKQLDTAARIRKNGTRGPRNDV